MDAERLKDMGKDQLIDLLQGNTRTPGRSAAKIECKEEPPAAPAASQASVPPVPTQAVDFNGSLVYKETGEEVTVEEMARVFQSTPEEIVLYIFKKDKMPYSVEEIKMWQESHGIKTSASVVEQVAEEVPERQDSEVPRAATLNHRSEPMSA